MVDKLRMTETAWPLVACSSSLVARSSSLVTYPTLWREQSRGVDALTDHLVDAQDGLYLVVG